MERLCRAAGRPGRVAAGPGTPRHQPARPRPAPRPAERPAAGLSRLPRPAGALVHHPRRSSMPSWPPRNKRSAEERRPSEDNGHGPDGDSPERRPQRRRAGVEAARVDPLRIVELHEVRSLNNQLAELRGRWSFDIDSLIPAGADRRGRAPLPAPPRRADDRPGGPPRPAGGRPRARAKRACKLPVSRAWAR